MMTNASNGAIPFNLNISRQLDRYDGAISELAQSWHCLTAVRELCPDLPNWGRAAVSVGQMISEIGDRRHFLLVEAQL